MAKIILTSPTSGKAGAIVYSRNRWGDYIRRLTPPTQPRTSHQLNQRARISNVAAQWLTLTDAQRGAWNTFAGNMTRSDRLGSVMQLNGYTGYMLMNTMRQVVGKSILRDPPQFWNGVTPDSIGFTVAASTFSFTGWLIGGAGTTTTGLQYTTLESCPAQSAGAMYARTWRLFKVVAPSTTFPIDVTTDWVARFGTIPAVADLRYFLRVKLVVAIDPPAHPSLGYVSMPVGGSVRSTLT